MEAELDLPPACQAAVDDASAAMDGEATEAEIWNARRHVRECACCRDLVAGMQVVTDELRAYGEHVRRTEKASPKLRWQIMELLRSKDPTFVAPVPPVGRSELRLVRGVRFDR